MRFAILPPYFAVSSLALLCTACGAAPANLGTFKVNGIDAPLGYAILVAMPPTGDTPRMLLVLSEKPPAPGADANMLSATGALGSSISAPIVQFPDEGWSAPAGFSYFHPSTKDKHGGWCAGTNCMLKDVVVEGGEFRAHLVSTAPPATTGESVVLDINLRIKMP